MERDPDISKTVANDRVVDATLKNKRRKRRRISYRKHFLRKNYYIKLNSPLKNKAIYIFYNTIYIFYIYSIYIL